MNIRNCAELALQQMREQGFDDAQVSAVVTGLDELNIAHNEASLLRSTQGHSLALLGLLDGRKASTELSDTSEEAVSAAVRDLFATVQSAPQDEANAVSAQQSADIEQGPQHADPKLLADKVAELLEYRAAQTPKMQLEEGACSHNLRCAQVLTSRGSELSSRVGSYSLSVMGTAKEGEHSSSFNYTGGSCHDPGQSHASELFGIGAMLRETERQIHTRAIEQPFVGEAVLAPMAVADLLEFLLEQVADFQLIAGSSLYRDSVGEQIASPLLSVRSRFDAPGVTAISADGFAVAPVELISGGELHTLLPGLYASRKTGIPHVPSLGSGWRIDAGRESREQLLGGVRHGALVGRLSMGRPAANGDCSGVIKNSFLLRDGEQGPALAEVMMTGNVAQMLRDIVAISSERLDTGATELPWIRIPDLHFS